MERTGQCHCGSLRVIATGEPERVYLCHCDACQRRTGTAFHFGATYPKEPVRLDGERKIYERDADSGYRIRFHFCPNCAEGGEFAPDSPLEGGGFEPSVPRHSKLGVAPATNVPGREDPSASATRMRHNVTQSEISADQ